MIERHIDQTTPRRRLNDEPPLSVTAGWLIVVLGAALAAWLWVTI